MTANDGDSAEALPLGWTKVRRRKRQASNDNDNDNNNNGANNDDDEDQCCIDEEDCLRRIHAKRPRSDNDMERPSPESSSTTIKKTMIEGQVIFCLQDTNPSWLQGYFFPTTTTTAKKKPWGLLAIQEELDECLACADGGFRQLTLKIYRPEEKQGSRPPKQISNIDWTGGDMMRLSHSDNDITMETDKLYAGAGALPYLNKFFATMVGKLRKECDVDDEVPVLEWMPDVAVILGTLSVSSSAVSSRNATERGTPSDKSGDKES